MKKLLLALAVGTMTACTSDNDPAVVGDGSAVAVKFTVSGDFTLTNTHDMTRALTADGKDMTDLWVFDYIGTECQQTIHQTSSDPDFGAPTLSLGLGNHHIYFVASRSTGATLDTDSKTLTFAKVLDTFYKDYPITITAATASGDSRSVSLDRVVTKLKVTFTDEIPANAATFNVTPALWYYGIDYTTGQPTSATANQAITLNIPTSSIGKTGEYINVYGFSGTTEWTTDIALNCKTASGDILGQGTIAAAPFVRNRVSEYAGPLFGDNGGFALSLNSAWDDSYQGSW